MPRVYLALGSNMGDRLAELSAAVASLGSLGQEIRVSGLYETAPVGGPPGQGAYLNCVVSLSTSAAPRLLLELAQRLEQEAGRVRTVRNGPRPLDVDILLYDDLVMDEPDLVIPHPRMYERAFVLAPLEELAPELVPDNWRERLGRGAVGEEVLRRVGRIESS